MGRALGKDLRLGQGSHTGLQSTHMMDQGDWMQVTLYIQKNRKVQLSKMPTLRAINIQHLLACRPAQCVLHTTRRRP